MAKWCEWYICLCKLPLFRPRKLKGDICCGGHLAITYGGKFIVPLDFIRSKACQAIADVAISKRPLLFTVWTQLLLRSQQKFFTKFLPANNFCQLLRVMRKCSCTSAGNAQAQLHFRDDQQRAFGISNISNFIKACIAFLTWTYITYAFRLSRGKHTSRINCANRAKMIVPNPKVQ